MLDLVGRSADQEPMPSVLVVGGGGREHALVDALVRSPSAPKVFAAPGNAGIEEHATCVSISVGDVDGLVAFARQEGIDLVVVGPEAPLVAGLADRCRAEGILVLGPSRAAAELEGSKAFAKTVMDDAKVPTARWGRFDEADAAVAFARTLPGAVVKADGLAAGKGVVVASSIDEAEAAIRETLGGKFGEAGRQLIVEERLEGEELSVIALADGKTVSLFAPSQDHKRAYDGDEGPNTGGMGAYSPAPRGTDALLTEVTASCLEPIVDCMASRGTPFSGVLYAGLMLTADGPRVLEYNVRFGDPEAQVLLPRLDEDAFALFVAAASGKLHERSRPTIAASAQAATCVVLAAEGYPASPRKGDVITGLDDAAAIEGVKVFHAGTRAEGDQILTAGGRVLGVTALGDDLLAATETAYRAVQRIAWDGMQYRKDIAHRALNRAVGS